MTRLYAGMDVHVLASHREGFPRSAMEAAAMGLPVVATNIRGCRQVVDDGVTGRLVAVRDPRALAAAIGELAGDPELRRRFGARELKRCASSTIGAASRSRWRRTAGSWPRRASAVAAGDVIGVRARVGYSVRLGGRCRARWPRSTPTALPGGFLVTLGPPFLRRLYRRIARSPGAFVLVADAPSRGAAPRRVCGFIAVAENTGAQAVPASHGAASRFETWPQGHATGVHTSLTGYWVGELVCQNQPA